MEVSPPTFDLSRKDPAVRLVARSWRTLTGGSGLPDPARRTLVACSGGADSSALALALAAAAGSHAPATVLIAHVIHDLRPPQQAHADRDVALSLARLLGLPFVQASIQVRSGPGNAEARARRERYKALAALARDHACPFVATAHHADDALETLLMRLMRGSGVKGLAGIREHVCLSNGIILIRPMLGLTRQSAEALCRRSAWRWATDATNSDTRLLRARVRAEVLPVLCQIWPKAAARAVTTSKVVAGAVRVIDREARRLLAQSHQGPAGDVTWVRADLRAVDPVVLGETLRHLARQVGPSARSDRLSHAVLARVIDAVNDRATSPRAFPLGALNVRVAAREVTVSGCADASASLEPGSRRALHDHGA